jgi:hypothetical protein
LAAELQEQSLAPVLDHREPRGLQSELRPLHVGLVLAVDVRSDGLEPREAGQRQHLAQAMELDDRLDFRRELVAAPGVATPGVVRQAARVEARIDRDVVAVTLRRGEQRVELDLLHRPLLAPAVPVVSDGLEDLRVSERGESRGDLWLLLEEGEEGEPGLVVDDLQVVPEPRHRRLNRGCAVGNRQHSRRFGEVGLGGGADQQAARELALLARLAPQPRPRPAADAERISLEQGGLVQAARPAALAAHHELGEVAAGASLVEPEFLAAGVLGAVDEAAPIQVVHMPLRAGADESGRHDLPAVEAAALVEVLPVDEAA